MAGCLQAEHADGGHQQPLAEVVKLGDVMLTEVRLRLTRQVHGRRPIHRPCLGQSEAAPPRRNTLSDRARNRLSTVFAADDATGKLQAAWLVKEQLRTLLATGSLADAAATQGSASGIRHWRKSSAPETNRLWRTVCR
ncbi:transposase [Arthrobacter sp. SD76]|uniref:transposase n=1 Tax=Arthrobacter sp. SD76 TaxID=3415007 RepID=UPI003C7513A5